MSLKCSDAQEACVMVVGGDSNNYISQTKYHLANFELNHIGSTGHLTIGSQNLADNVSDIYVDALSASFVTASFDLVSSEGSIRILNGSSTLEMSAHNSTVVISAAQNASINTSLVVTMRGTESSIGIYADSQCAVENTGDAKNARFVISSSGSLVIASDGQQVAIYAPAVDIDGALNVSRVVSLVLEGAKHDVS